MARPPLPAGKSRLLRRHVLASDERVLLETHPSKWFYFFGPLFWLVVLGLSDDLVLEKGYPFQTYVKPWVDRLRSLPHPGGFSSFASLWATVSVALAAVFVLWLAIAVLRWINQTYVVTDSRLVEQIGIVRHTIQEIPLRQIRDVIVYQRTFLGRALRFGNIQFKTLLEADQEKARAMEVWAEHHFDPRGQFSFQTGHPETILPYRRTGSGASSDRPRGVQLDRSQSRDIRVEFDSGVEWWIGTPNPFLFERTVEGLLRGASTPASTAAGAN